MENVNDGIAHLKTLQKWFRDSVMRLDGVVGSTKGIIGESPSLAASARLKIYASAYRARCLESLEDDFKRVRRLIGPERFRNVVFEYIAARPSRSFTLADLGHAFSKFLESHELAQEFLFLEELAALEWAGIESFYADNLPALDSTRLGDVAPETWGKARIGLHPSVRLLEVRWPVRELWERWSDENVFERSKLWRPGVHRLLVYRKSYEVSVHEMEAAPFRILRLLSEGCALGYVCEAALDDARVRNAFGNWFQQWVTDGILGSVEFET